MSESVLRRIKELERACGGAGGDSPWCQCARECSVRVVWTVEGEPEPPAEVCSVCGRPIRRVTWDDIELAPQSEVV